MRNILTLLLVLTTTTVFAQEADVRNYAVEITSTEEQGSYHQVEVTLYDKNPEGFQYPEGNPWELVLKVGTRSKVLGEIRYTDYNPNTGIALFSVPNQYTCFTPLFAIHSLKSLGSRVPAITGQLVCVDLNTTTYLN